MDGLPVLARARKCVGCLYEKYSFKLRLLNFASNALLCNIICNLNYIKISYYNMRNLGAELQ